MLAVVCKRKQQFPTMLGPAVHRVMRVRGPNNVGGTVQRIQHFCTTFQRSRDKRPVFRPLTGKADIGIYFLDIFT